MHDLAIFSHQECFKTFFVVNDEHYDVEVLESLTIDWEEIVAWLKLGGSVFITHVYTGLKESVSYG